MRGKVLRLSPNEEAQLLREEQDRRRKLRLQQVREQERFIARQVRRQVQERRQQQMQTLAYSLQLQWQQQHALKLQALSTHYQHSLRSVGHGQRSAQENEPDLEALAQRSVEQQERAEERHREALRELSARRHEEEQQQRRHIDARRKALLEEKRRAERVSSLPPPPPDPLESVGKITPRPLRSAAAERFSLTHCHMTLTAVDRESDPEQQRSAQQAAALEEQRLEELQRDEARERQQRLEKARLRGGHALQREQHSQDRARLLCELERLQQAHLLRRRHTVSSVPPQVFQPLCRQPELRDEQQRELEIAFQDVYSDERKVKGDLVLQLVPEPLPALSADSHDEELDVTLDPECAPEGEEPETLVTETPASPPVEPGRRALSRLLERIRRQRERRTCQLTPETPGTSHDADTQEEALSVETGSLISQDKAGGSLEEQTPSTTHTEDAPDGSEEVVAGTLLTPEQVRLRPGADSEQHTHVQVLLRQQQEQLALLEELEEKRRELEQRWRDSQQTSGTPQEPLAEVRPDVTHTQRLHQYQQRLLEQNRLHKKCVEEARRRLEEYQHTLKLRQAIGSTSVPLQTRSEIPDPPLALIPDPRALHVCQLPSPPAPSQPLVVPPDPHGSDRSRSSGDPPQEPPLPPAAVVLELLRSRRGPAETGAVLQRTTADRQGPVSSLAEDQTHRMILNTLLNAIEEVNGRTDPSTAPSQRDTHTTAALLDDCDPAPVHRGRVKPPVSRPPARLAFLQQMEQHELSAIQEVDTPVNISLDTELQSADVSESSASLPIVSSEDGHSASQRSQVTGRISRMSWRETLLHDSTASASLSSGNHQRERCGADPDYLSSTTISTGSYSTSDLEASCAVSDASRLCFEPDVCGPSPGPSSCHMTTERDSVQQIIDRYSKELSASLRHAGETAGAVNASSASQSWSSVLQEESSLQRSSAELSGVFQPLQPHPDIDSSSSSSSSRNAVREDPSSRAQGWSETVTQVLERLSGQLSIRQSEQGHGTTPADPPHRDLDRHRQNRPGPVSNTQLGQSTHSGEGQSESGLSDGCESGKASEMGWSQEFDQSSVLADGTGEVTRSTAAGSALCFSPLRSSLQPSVSYTRTDDALTDATHDDASDLFLPLPSDVTTNESADCSSALCVPLAADASDWLERTDQSLQQLRADTLLQSQSELQTSADALSLTHESLCDTDTPPLSAPDLSLLPRSPLRTAPDLAPQLPSQDVPSQDVPSQDVTSQDVTSQLSAGQTLTELLERAQEEGDLKGILEESTISFISLPESTLLDPELSLTQTPGAGSAAQEVESECCLPQEPSRSRAEEQPEACFPRAVMRLEFQSGSAEQCQRRRDRLAQRSALRAAQVRARHTEPGQTTAVRRASRATARTDPRPHTADGLKSTVPVRISSEEEMYRRTHRLYSQLEEVKQKEELRSRQDSYAKNREKARDFQRKTLEKLRAKLNR